MERIWTIQEVLDWTSRRFAQKGIEQPRLEAEVLISHALGKDRIGLYINNRQPLVAEELAACRELIRRRLRGVPAAYLTGKKEFMSLSFKVSEAVLIPRPETELLVETAVDLGRTVLAGQSLTIVDVGTGSGVIAICLGRFLPAARVVGIDISPEALRIAAENARNLAVADRVSFLEGDLLEPLTGQGWAGKVDLITANLPYIPAASIETLQPEVREYEPRLALAGGGDGLDLYRRLVPAACAFLKPGGYFLAEIGANQGHAARLLFSPECWQDVTVKPDYAGHDRVLQAQRRKQP